MDTPPLPRRKTIRLQNYDYSQNGAYFVTICTAHKRPLFGVVRRGDPCGRPPVPVYAELSEIGRIVESYLTEIPSHYPDVHLASYVIMPDHIHMVLVLTQNQPERAGQCPAPTEVRRNRTCHAVGAAHLGRLPLPRNRYRHAVGAAHLGRPPFRKS